MRAADVAVIMTASAAPGLVTLLADASPEWSPLVGTIVNVGFSGTVAWYLLTKAGPNVLGAFREELKEIRAKAEASDDRRRVEAEKSLDVVIKHCEAETARHHEVFRVEMGLVTMALKDTRESLEEVRDSLRSLQEKRLT